MEQVVYTYWGKKNINCFVAIKAIYCWAE